MLVTSASKAIVPGIDNLLLTRLNKAFGLAELRCREADVSSKLNRGGKLELRLAVGVADMNVYPTFLPREEVKTEFTLTKDGG
jgi:hypothetical protein